MLGPELHQAPKHGDPVEPGEQEVENDQVVRPLAGEPEPLRAVGRGIDEEAVRGERPGDEAGDLRFVVDDEDRLYDPITSRPPEAER